MTKSQIREFLFEAKHLTGLLVAAATVAVFLYMEVAAFGQSMGSALPQTPSAANPFIFDFSSYTPKVSLGMRGLPTCSGL